MGDELENRLHIIVSGSPLCLADEVIANHLLIRCWFATKVLAAVCNRFGMLWVMP